MRTKSAGKIKQIQDLMQSLQLTAQPKQVFTKDGFLELTIIYTDREQYPNEPAAPTEAKEPEQKDAEAPVL